jgi:hypothetical protein
VFGGSEFALRRIKQGFREHSAETDPAQVAKLLKRAATDLQMMRRQVCVCVCV